MCKKGEFLSLNDALVEAEKSADKGPGVYAQALRVTIEDFFTQETPPTPDQASQDEVVYSASSSASS